MIITTTKQNWLLGGALCAVLCLGTVVDFGLFDDLKDQRQAAGMLEQLPTMETERLQELQKMQRSIDAQIAKLAQRAKEHERMMSQLLKDAEKFCGAIHGEAAARVTDSGSLICLSKKGRKVSTPLGPQA
jgi:hypothetical protein